MAEISAIEWTDVTWNPVTGCTRASAGCDNCYAVTMTRRLAAMGQSKYAGLVNEGKRHFNGVVRAHDDALDRPFGWRKPRHVFVNSMSDLFHRDVPINFIANIFAVMAATPHTYQVLTKRAEWMATLLNDAYFWQQVWMFGMERWWDTTALAMIGELGPEHPLPNVWLGTSVEDQSAADERIPHLLRTPAAVRFLSCEPLLGPITFTRLHQYCPEHDFPGGFCTSWHNGIRFVDWVIVGGESGPGARPCDVAWIRSIAQQCREASVPVFVKQVGANVRDRNDAGWEADTEWFSDTGEWTDPTGWPSSVGVEHDPNGFREEYQGAPVRVLLRDKKGGDMSEWPADLRVREMPLGAAR